MQKNKLTIMGVFTAVILIAALFAVKQESDTVRNDQAGNYLFPELKNRVNDVVELEIVQRNSKFSVKNIEGEWKVVEKNNYPAQLPKIKQTLLRIADLTTIDAKTKLPENYEKIGVEDPAGEKATSSLIKLKDKDAKVLAALIVGKQQTASLSNGAAESLYVRKPDDEQSWLVKGELRIDPKEKDWLVTELFDIPVKRVQKVSLVKAGKTTVQIAKKDIADKDYSLLDIPKKKEIKNNTEINAIAEGVSNVVIKDVDTVTSTTAVSFDNDVFHADFFTFDGLVVSVDTVKARGLHFAKFSARFDPSLRVEPSAQGKEPSAQGKEPSAQGKEATVVSSETASTQVTPADDKSQTVQTASAPQPPALKDAGLTAKEAEELNQKFNGWVFEISSTKADNLRKGMDDLLKVPS